MSTSLSPADWVALFGQYLLLSLLSVSGAIGTVPDMHRYLVDQHGWLSDLQFNASITIAQSAPGPNVLFVALMGWNVGLNAGGGLAGGPHAWALGLLGLTITMGGILLPSSLITYNAARWGQRNRHRRSVRAFKQGMTPLVIGLLLSTGWILVRNGASEQNPWGAWAVALVSALLVWRTRIHLLWLLGAGAVAGAFGLV
ncbi:chromate transporter [Xylophilus sp. GOD-11R]|uniref:chromate transporter n=1 Tax=Xylophilus sp. GOD-11R TaxID=3089814 RepID=UPI00298CDD96|nr:chromate transporter [Xylophilus sp. GOD-11R]WPB58206.1 chromate transporter [Xylophilus sp. GOD-11R]